MAPPYVAVHLFRAGIFPFARTRTGMAVVLIDTVAILVSVWWILQASPANDGRKPRLVDPVIYLHQTPTVDEL